MVVIQAQNINNSADGSHYAGMTYVIVERRVGAFENKYKTVESGVLNENGYANTDLKMHFNRTYDLGIEEPNNTCFTEITIKHSLKLDQNNDVNFKYATCGYTKIQMNNVNCEGDNDKMQYRYHYTDNPDIYTYRGFSNLNEWYSNLFVEGCIDKSGSYFSVPNGNYTFEWRVIRPSGTTTGIDYFTVNKNDTTTYLLEY